MGAELCWDGDGRWRTERGGRIIVEGRVPEVAVSGVQLGKSQAISTAEGEGSRAGASVTSWVSIGPERDGRWA